MFERGKFETSPALIFDPSFFQIDSLNQTFLLAQDSQIHDVMLTRDVTSFYLEHFGRCHKLFKSLERVEGVSNNKIHCFKNLK